MFDFLNNMGKIRAISFRYRAILPNLFKIRRLTLEFLKNTSDFLSLTLSGYKNY